jgi:hypothetical protein
MVVVIQVSGRCFVFVSGESLYRPTVGKEEVGPSVVIVIEDDGAIAGGFDYKFFVSVSPPYTLSALSPACEAMSST